MPESNIPNSVPDAVAENHAVRRVELGLSWDDLAAAFLRDGATDLAAWATADRSNDPAFIVSATEAAEKRKAAADAEEERTLAPVEGEQEKAVREDTEKRAQAEADAKAAAEAIAAEATAKAAADAAAADKALAAKAKADAKASV